MKFGVFDQNDYCDGLVADHYEARFQLAELYEKSGFYIYHMSEHHGTPLSRTPSPSVFLAALSQRTKILRLGPLVYLLPGYNPMRLVEEICMLDHLSRGRFDFGVGRGASPREMEYLGVTADDMKPMYAEALDILKAGLETGVLNHRGRYWTFEGVELSLRPYQTPGPPMWAAVSSPESAAWPARNGVNIVVGAPAERAREVFGRYLAERHAVSLRGPEPLLGLNRYFFVADTDEQALEIGRRAWAVFYASFIKLWRRYGTRPGARLPEDFDQLLASGTAMVGTPGRVRDTLVAQVEASCASYVGGNFVFGNISQAEASVSIALFAREVMPAVVEAGERAQGRLREAA